MGTKIKYIISAFVFWLISQSAFSANPSEVLDLTDEWLTYVESEEVFLPVLSNKKQYYVLQQKIPFSNNRHYSIEFSPNENVSLFINGGVYGRFHKDSLYRIEVEKFAPFVDKDFFVMSFSSGETRMSPFSIKLVNQDVVERSWGAISYELTERDRSFTNDVLLMATLLLCLVLAVMKTQDSGKLNAYLSPVSIFSGRKVDDYIVNGAASLQGVPFVLLASFLWGTTLIYNGYSIVDLQNLSGDTHFETVLKYLLWNTGAIFLFFVFKYLFLRMLAFLISMRKMSDVYFFEIVRFYSLSGFGLLLSSVLFSSFEVFDSLLLQLALIFLLVWVVRISFIFIKDIGLHKIFIIAYLCTSEIFPLFILIKGITSF